MASAQLGVLAVAIIVAAVILQGCGSSSGGNTTVTTTTVAPTHPPAVPSGPATSLRPMCGISYRAMPPTASGVALPGMDMMQVGYKAQWGNGANERDDLGLMKSLGANTVRLYHALGAEDQTDHSAFLDRAEDLGLHVLVGFNTQNLCPNLDCHESWRAAMAGGFNQGLIKKGKWHPAISMIVLLDAPDNLNFGSPTPTVCNSGSLAAAQCRLKVSLSALDGFLAAERAAAVEGTVNITVAWSFAVRDSIASLMDLKGFEKKVKQMPGIYGFQDMQAGVADPSIANYTAKDSSAMTAAYHARWINSVNTGGSPWSFIKENVADTYGEDHYNFSAQQWFIAEYTAATEGTDITNDLRTMHEAAKAGGPFLGVTFTEFQKDYETSDNYGLYGLGDVEVGPQSYPCQEDIRTKVQQCQNYAANCLDETKGGAKRARSVAAAWGGSIVGHGTCLSIKSLLTV